MVVIVCLSGAALLLRDLDDILDGNVNSALCQKTLKHNCQLLVHALKLKDTWLMWQYKSSCQCPTQNLDLNLIMMLWYDRWKTPPVWLDYKQFCKEGLAKSPPQGYNRLIVSYCKCSIDY